MRPKRFRDWSLRSKLTLMTTAVSALGILLATCIFVALEQNEYRKALLSDLHNLAHVMAINCAASVDAGDARTTEALLSSLSALEHIRLARVRTPEGSSFATYSVPGTEDIVPDDHLWITHPVSYQGRYAGRVTIASDLSPVHNRVNAQISTMAVLLLATLLFVGFLATRVQAMVSRPVQELSRVAAGIAQARSFHLRAKKEGDDELGQLTDAFNTMLGELQQRDLDLQDAYLELDKRRREELAKETALRVKLEEELKQSLEQLQQTQKMESIGRLAGGVAHDFNNMLTAISGYTQMLMKELKGDESLTNRVIGIVEATNRAAALTKKLLAFSRKQVLKPAVMDLNETIHDLEDMLSRIIGDRVVLRTDLADELPSIEADEGQIEQVLVNLVINAVDAMPEGGTVVIQTRAVEDTDVRNAYPGQVRPGRYVLLTVTDTGHGMDKQIASQIFEPFFTTKPRGKGTGMGLSTVYGIVNQSNGIVTVDSVPEEGATFSIFLPCSNKDRARRRSRDTVEIEADLFTGRGTVLVAEDEEMIRDYVAQVLQGCGYKVLAADDGATAVELAENGSGPIDVIVSDVMMPTMTGPEAVDRIRLSYPEIGVIFMSGYTQDGGFADTIRRNKAAFLQKPFSAADLSRAVRDMLKLHKAA